MRFAFGLAAVLSAVTVAAAESPRPAPKLPPAASGPIDFAKDVWPILNQHCVKCHNADKRKGGLAMTDGATFLAGGDSGKVLIPGKSGDSKLIHLVAGIDADARMPPEGTRLTAAQIGALRAWIDRGAKWDSAVALVGDQTKSKHWSFQPITRPPLPEVRESNWVRNGIDRFILARLEKERLAPSPEADRTTLIRRLSLRPDRPAADAGRGRRIRRTTNRPTPTSDWSIGCLRSPHYGERWGRHWLDLARYADSRRLREGHRPAVGLALSRLGDRRAQRDMPFDQFTIEQLAGDLLPDPTIGAEDRHRLPPQHADQQGRRHRSGAVPRRGRRRSRQHDRHGLARH